MLIKIWKRSKVKIDIGEEIVVAYLLIWRIRKREKNESLEESGLGEFALGNFCVFLLS